MWQMGMALLLAGLAGMAEARAPLEDSALKPLCDRLCGGTWRDANPPTHSDAFFTSYHFEFDDASGLVRGEALTVGGIAGITARAILLYGADDDGGIWTLSADGKGVPVYGKLQTSADGFQVNQSPIGTTTDHMITTVTFPQPDLFTRRDEIVTRTGSILGAEQRYRRTKD